MFKVGSVYTHDKMLDVCMLITQMVSDEPLKYINRPGAYYYIRVRWFKKNGLDLNATDEIRINCADLERWKEC